VPPRVIIETSTFTLTDKEGAFCKGPWFVNPSFLFSLPDSVLGLWVVDPVFQLRGIGSPGDLLVYGVGALA
jgi:hypothetical protein